MLIDINQIRNLSQLNPHRSLTTLLADWVFIAAAITLHLYFTHPAVYLLTWVLIGTRMYALYSLLHDGIHYLLLPIKPVNDWICKLLLAGPLFISLQKMRKYHLAHHQYLKTSDDPEAEHLSYSEFQFPKSEMEWLFIFMKDIIGFNFIYYKMKKLVSELLSVFGKKSKNKKNVKKHMYDFDPAMLLYYAIIGASLLYKGWGIQFLLYWILPYITIYQALNRLRLITEHFYLPPGDKYQTRTAKLNFFEKFIFSPHNLGFHTEHHLYPSVPFYNLPVLHNSLMKVSEFQKNVILIKNYLTNMRSLCGKRFDKQMTNYPG